MQECLPLSGSAENISSSTIILDLSDMPFHREPPLYLPFIIFCSSAKIISAIPLKPPPRVLWIYPTLGSPNCKRLTGIYFKEVELLVPLFVCGQLSFSEPTPWKLSGFIRHIQTTKNPKLEHLFRSQIWFKECFKIFYIFFHIFLRRLKSYFTNSPPFFCHSTTPPIFLALEKPNSCNLFSAQPALPPD